MNSVGRVRFAGTGMASTPTDPIDANDKRSVACWIAELLIRDPELFAFVSQELAEENYDIRREATWPA